MTSNVRIYLLAGILTVPGFFSPLEKALRTKFENKGYTVKVEEFYPYGTYEAGLFKQLKEVRHDLRLYPHLAATSIGGGRLVKALHCEKQEGSLIFIGHSAGGIAACHAAYVLWKQYHLQVQSIVCIGSPKMKMPRELNSRTLYLVQRKKWRRDLFSYFGSWGGLEKRHPPKQQQRLIPILNWKYNRYKHAPIKRLEVMTLGTHADYFRDQPPYVQASGSNLDIMMKEMEQHLFR